MRTYLCAALLTCVVGWCGAPALAADWPQMLGPQGTGISPETGLIRQFPDGGPEMLWGVNLGQGFAGAAIEGGRVYVLDRQKDAEDVLRCLDLTTGKDVWTPYVHEAPGASRGYNGSRNPPTVDDKHVYAVGMKGDLYCLDKATGKPAWKANLVDDFGARPMQWGIGQSPAVYKDTVIVAPLSRQTGVVAYAKADGTVAWKSEPLGGLGYVSPIVTTIDGVDQVVIISLTQTAGLDAASGKLLWSYKGWTCSIPIPNVTPIGDGRLFITGGYNAGSAMIQVSKAEDGWTAKELYKIEKIGSQIHSAILFKGYLYAACNTNNANDGLVCFDLDGTVKWKTGGNPNFERGGYLIADGLMYIVDGNSGALSIVEPSPEGFKQLSRCQPFQGKTIWAPLALSDGKLVIRDQTKMLCLDIKAK